MERQQRQIKTRSHKGEWEVTQAAMGAAGEPHEPDCGWVGGGCLTRGHRGTGQWGETRWSCRALQMAGLEAASQSL